MSGVVALIAAGVAVPAHAQSEPPLVFDRVTVVDVTRGELVPEQRVMVVGNRVKAVGAVQTVKLPKSARVVDARGKFLIPGLWDMHVHPQRFTSLVYPLFVANGVTGIRDAGSEVPLDTLRLLRREILAGTRVGPPRQILSGRAIDEDSTCHRDPKAFHTCVSTPADARHLVDSLKAACIDMLKTYLLSKEMYAVIAADAKRAGVPFGGHVYWETAAEASDNGATIVDHINASGDIDAVCLWKASYTFTIIDLFPRLHNPNNATVENCRQLAERFVRNGTWWVPTLTNYGGLAARSRSIVKQLATYARQFWSDSTRNPYAPDRADSTPPYTVNRPSPDSLGYLYLMGQAGLPIVAGTDLMAGEEQMRTTELPGFALHAELATYEAEGLTPLQALRAATLNPAKLLHATDSLGIVARGKLADLLLLDANPLVEIVNTTKIRAVVANGRYFDRVALDGLLADVQARAKAKAPSGP